MEYSITIIGAATMDISAHALPSGKLQAQDSHPGVITTSPGGVGRNIAENLGRLGCAATLITALGEDAFTTIITRNLDDAGVDYAPSLRCSGECDRYLSWHDAAGEMSHALHQTDRIDEVTPDAISVRAEYIRNARLVVLDSNLAPATIAAIMACAKSLPVPPLLAVEAVSAFKCPRLTPHLGEIDLLKCNRMEAATLTASPPETAAQELTARLHEKGVKRVILSLGADGFLVSGDGDGQHHASPAPASAASMNVTGAGDALLAGFIAAMADGRNMTEAATMAGRAAEFTLRCSGAVHPDISWSRLTGSPS